MWYMLDTDICSYIIKKRPQTVLHRLEKIPMEQICISSITYAELSIGIEMSSSLKINQQVLDEFTRYLTILPWDEHVVPIFSKLYVDLRKRGVIIGDMDTMIAAHALSVDATLVTNNLRHFTRVSQLKLENWNDDLK